MNPSASQSRQPGGRANSDARNDPRVSPMRSSRLAGVGLIAWVVVAALAQPACERSDSWDRPLGTHTPVALHSAAAYAVPGLRAVAFYHPASNELRWVELEAVPLLLRVAPGRDGVLVLDDEEGATWITVEDGVPTREARYELGGQFRAVTFATDGDKAIVHHDPTTLDQDLIVNPNQIGIVDLSRGFEAGENPVRRTIRSFGSAPRSIFIAPSRTVSGQTRQLAWVLSERYLALLDLNAPRARERIVPLTLPADERNLVPQQVVFGEFDGALTAFVRAQGAEDIFALTFPEEAPADEVPKPHLNKLHSGNGPSDMAFRQTDEGPRLFVVNAGDQTLSVIDPMTGGSVAVATTQAVARMLPFQAPRPDDTLGESALLWSESGGGVVFADLELVERRRGRALTPLHFEGGIRSLAPIPGRRGAAATLDTRRLLLLDFDDQTATTLMVSGTPEDLQVDPSGERVYAVTNGSPFAVVSVDVDTGSPFAAEVPSGSGTLMLIPGADRLMVDHGHPAGHVSVLPLADVNSDQLFERKGLMFERVFDR